LLKGSRIDFGVLNVHGDATRFPLLNKREKPD
jgi:hypothetical protein